MQGQNILVDARNVGIGPEDALQQIFRAEGDIGGVTVSRHSVDQQWYRDVLDGELLPWD